MADLVYVKPPMTPSYDGNDTTWITAMIYKVVGVQIQALFGNAESDEVKIRWFNADDDCIVRSYSSVEKSDSGIRGRKQSNGDGHSSTNRKSRRRRQGTRNQPRNSSKRRYSCNQCTRDFCSRSVLECHINRDHKGIKPYKCSFNECNQRFHGNEDLRKHQRLKHPKWYNERKNDKTIQVLCPKVEVETVAIGGGSETTLESVNVTNSNAMNVVKSVIIKSEIGIPDDLGVPPTKKRKRNYDDPKNEDTVFALNLIDESSGDCGDTEMVDAAGPPPKKKRKRISSINIKRHDVGDHGKSNEVIMGTTVLMGTKVQCNECGKVLSSKGSLKTHIGIFHSDFKQFQCKLCGKEYGAEGSLVGHLRTKHKSLYRMHCRKYRTDPTLRVRDLYRKLDVTEGTEGTRGTRKQNGDKEGEEIGSEKIKQNERNGSECNGNFERDNDGMEAMDDLTEEMMLPPKINVEFFDDFTAENMDIDDKIEGDFTTNNMQFGANEDDTDNLRNGTDLEFDLKFLYGDLPSTILGE